MRAGYFTMPLHPPGADPGRTMTRRMKLGTGVSCLPNHNPLMLAMRLLVDEVLPRL